MSRLPTQSFGLRHKNGTAILMGFSGLRMDRETMELHMVDVLSHNHSIPKFIGRTLPFFRLMGANKYFSNDRLQMRNEILSDILKRLSCRIEESLSSIIPEFTPLQCKAASLYEYPNVIDFTKQMIRENVDSIVVLPLYPFYQTVHGSLILKKISTFLENVTRHNISMESKPDESRYFFSDASTSLTVKIPPDMGLTGIFVQYWAEQLIFLRDDYDAIIFAIPATFLSDAESMHKIYRSLWNIGYKIFCNTERENFLWRMAFYRTWDQLQPIIFRNTIKRQLEFFKSIGKSRILVVPIANLIPDVDTEFVLPSTISRISGNTAHLIDLEKLLETTTLQNALSELIKNRILSL